MTVTFLLPHCCTETFKLPQSWQFLADHRWPALKPLPVAESSAANVACSQTGLCDRLHFHTDQSPFTCSLPSRWCHHAFTQTHAWNVSALPLSLNHYLPLFTFPLLPKKQYQTSCSPHWTHTCVRTHINTGPTSRLMLIWHHQRGVLGYTGLCVHTEPKVETVLLPPHKHIRLLRLRSDFWNRMICLSQLHSAAPWLQTDLLSFPLCLWGYLFFCLSSLHKAQYGQCHVCLLSPLSSHEYYPTSAPKIHQHINAEACSVLQVWT